MVEHPRSSLPEDVLRFVAYSVVKHAIIVTCYGRDVEHGEVTASTLLRGYISSLPANGLVLDDDGKLVVMRKPHMYIAVMALVGKVREALLTSIVSLLKSEVFGKRRLESFIELVISQVLGDEEEYE